MKKFYCFILAASLLTGNLLAQTIKGTVITPQGDPLPAANIRIFRPDSSLIKACSTDSKGIFNERIEETAFTVHVSFIGYRDHVVFIRNEEQIPVDLGKIPLEEESIEINSVSVKANRRTEYIDRLVVIPSAIQIQSSADGLGLLNSLHLPGLFIDEINRTVRIDGTSAVVYKINGIPVGLERIVALRPEQVLRVEYSQDPSARYLASNSGVINVILRKDRPGVYLSANALGAVATGFLNGGATASAIYERSEIRLGYDVSWRDYTRRGQYQENTYTLGDKVYEQFHYGRESPMGYLYNKVDAGYTYRQNKSTLDVNVSTGILDGFQQNRADIHSGNSTSPLYDRLMDNDSQTVDPQLNIYYIYQWDQDRGLEANLTAQYSKNTYHRELYDDYMDGHFSQVLTDTREIMKSTGAEVYYYNNTHQKLNYHVGMQQSGQLSENTTNDSEQDFRRFQSYPYAGLGGSFGQFSYQVGTGLKYVHTKIAGKTYDEAQNITSLSLLYHFQGGTVRNYTRYSTDSPSLSLLNTAEVQENEFVIRTGNPQLKSFGTFSNRSTVSIALTESLQWTSGIFYKKAYRAINTVHSYHPESDLLVSIPVNSDYNRQWKLSSTLQWNSIFDIFSLSAGIDWSDYRNVGESHDYRYDNLSWWIMLNAAYKNFSLNAAYSKPERWLSGQTISQRENYSLIGVGYKQGSWSIGAGVYYPFEVGTKYRSWSLDPNARNYRYTYIKDNGNMFYLRATFTFSSGKPLFGVNRRLAGQQVDSSIIKISE